MAGRYSAVYRDANGEEICLLENDDRTMRLTVRGVTFTGPSPDNLEPTVSPDDPALSAFTLYQYINGPVILWYCTLLYDVVLPLVTPSGEIVPASLRVSLEMDFPARGDLEYPIVTLTLVLNGKVYQSRGDSGWFEDELLEIQRALPEGYYLKACINCAFSDYGVAGHQTFGDMLCFRGSKEAYRRVRTKWEYMQLKVSPEAVQETFLCPEFERRIPGTGYRG